MLINLTNHPLANWSKSQLSEAKQYGEIIDMPFPVIDPAAEEEAINILADEYVGKIKGLADYPDVIILVMGEMNFTYCLVTKLKALGIVCVASTTKRNVIELDGKVVSEFKFVRFRKY
jgi:hypothetical protein